VHRVPLDGIVCRRMASLRRRHAVGMPSLLDRRLIVVTGKGGVGKTTIAGALGVLAAGLGRRAIVVEVGRHRRLPAMLGYEQPADSGRAVELGEGLSSLSIDPDRVLADWLRALGGRVSARVLMSSSTFQHFVAAAPGAREILSMVKVYELTEERDGSPGRGRRRARGAPDLVILDAPATGHALAMLSSPQTFAALARVGPIASQSRHVSELLRDPARTGYVAVAQGTEMAVSETLQLRAGLHEQLGQELDAVVVNSTLPRRFDEPERRLIAGIDADHPAVRSAVLAAAAVHERARVQHNQIARLRRRGLRVLGVPFLFQAELDRAALERIATRLRRGL
jgi:anion-transporting  ArsA/GET3 family ATPase